MKRSILLLSLCLSTTLFAETLFDVTVAQTPADPKVKVVKGAGFDIVKEGNTSCFAANGKKGAVAYYNLSQIPSLGTDNLTFSVLFQIKGKSGYATLVSKGAGSHLSPGYRLGIAFEKGRPQLYALFVPASSRPGAKKFVQFAMDKNLTLPLNEWIHAAMTVDRAGKITLYINGEEAGSRSIAAYEKEDVFEKEKNSNFASYLGGEIRIARVKVKNDLSSRIQIQKETDQWLDSVEE